ncbi:acyl-CoA carboxylase subunit beta [Leptolinea tardivitalis]|uniref:Methylmalonyl-CoA carboxyltransferase n=1 Tax=Leptolinea tardivitalis TaxID=229920 RepID=A0A0P6WTB7_9CHLR|nr:acyl-CoA carboxylase subunit beta [Leptolinea tardivitalis]KPL72398.1 methylmalonyl-CoA carboxyltransferase [Leptolinea tardivitalis]GAP22766.1 propionyl-CoA carboxylase carboxyltransferase subunit [Leptolinea tardivitalis]
MENKKIHSFNERRSSALNGGGLSQIEKQHSRGKLTARERIEKLLDPGSFVETGMYVTHHATGFGMENQHPYTDGVVTGWGKIDNRLVYIFAQDFTILGGSLGEAHGRKIAYLMDLAYQNGAPIIGLNDSGGARIQEGVASLDAYGEIFFRNTRASGVIPQISIILGPTAGGSVYSPGINDFIFMVEKTSNMFITGPEVIKAVTHEEIDFESLGGSSVHSEKSGVAHFSADNEEVAFLQVRELLSYLPQNNLSSPPIIHSSDDPKRQLPEINNLIPDDPQIPYEIRDVISLIADDGNFFEVQSDYAQNIVIGFSRLNGKSVGFVANQPNHLAGVLDINASDKAARFIRFCDAFHIPLITLVDTPGFLPGSDQEHNGIIRHGAKLIYAYAEATVPKIALILRKAYGGAYIVMSSKQLKCDYNLAWPQAEIAVMGPEGAVKIIFRKDIQESPNPKKSAEEKTRLFREEFANPYQAASRGSVDDVILPEQTRQRIIEVLESLHEKRQETPARKHGNIPL